MRKSSTGIFDEFHRMVKGDLDAETEQHHLSRLKNFAGVREFPARVKCAILHSIRCARRSKDAANLAPPLSHDVPLGDGERFAAFVREPE
jgi:nitrogen fixation NifU-like protein